MNSAIERLTSLRVKDVMRREVLTVEENDDVKEAARTIYEHDITGVPVVNSIGHCVGVLTASDFVAHDADQIPSELFVRDSPKQAYRVEILEDDRVRTYMTPFVQTIEEEATLLNAARTMCGEHIHRLFVMDDQKRPIGVVSALDVVAATIAAIEE